MLATSLQAQFGRGTSDSMHNWEEDLYLSEEQIIDRQTIRNDYHTSRNTLIDKIQEHKLDLRNLLDEKNPSSENIKTVYSQIDAMEQSLEALWLNHRHAIRAILNEDQRVIFDNYMHGNGRMMRGGNDGMFRGRDDAMNNNNQHNR